VRAGCHLQALHAPRSQNLRNAVDERRGNTAVKTIKLGGYPVAVAITPDSKTAYVADGGSDTVTPIRVATNTALKPITTGRSPDAIAITP